MHSESRRHSYNVAMDQVKDRINKFHEKVMDYITDKKKDEPYIIISSKCKGGVARVDGPRVAFGYCNQAQMGGRYAGLQCTTMSLSAILYWYTQEHGKNFRPHDVNKVLVQGHSLHARLRKMKRFGRIRDGMVGISDFPHDGMVRLNNVFTKDMGVRLATESVPVLTSEYAANFGLQSLKEYLETFEPTINRVGFLVTIKCFTYAIIRDEDRFHIFDSHGHLKLQDKLVVNRGMVITFKRLQGLIGMLQGMYGLQCQCDVAPIISYVLDKEPMSTRDHTLCQGLRQSKPRPKLPCSYSYRPCILSTSNDRPTVNPIFNTNKISPSAFIDEDDIESPYVGLMGGC